MSWKTGRQVLVLRASKASLPRVRAITRWARALLPAAVLVVTPLDDPTTDTANDSIVLEAEEVASGPLALADAIARAAKGSSGYGES